MKQRASALSAKVRSETAHAISQQTQRFGSWVTGRFRWRDVAQTLLFHHLCGCQKALGTLFFHGQEAKCLRQRNAIGAGLQKFDVGRNFAKHRPQGNVAHGSGRNRASRKDGGTSTNRHSLQHAHEVFLVDAE